MALSVASLAGRAVRGGASFALVLAIWSAVSLSGLISPILFPAPWTVVAAGVEMAAAGTLLSDVAISAQRAVVGFLIGAGLGVFTGLLTGRVALLRTLLNPFLSLMRPIPAIALAPVAIVWFGIGEPSKYFLISYTVFLAVWFNTHHGMSFVPEIYIRASRSLGASRMREFLIVVIPAAAPHIAAGLRLGVALALLSLVAAELTGASSGIGYRLQEARQFIRVDRMFALLVILGAIGALVDALAERAVRRLVHWEQV